MQLRRIGHNNILQLKKQFLLSRLSVFLKEEHVLGVLVTWHQDNVLIGGKERLHMVYSG